MSSSVMVSTAGLRPVKLVWISIRSMSLTIRSGGFSRSSAVVEQLLVGGLQIGPLALVLPREEATPLVTRFSKA